MDREDVEQNIEDLSNCEVTLVLSGVSYPCIPCVRSNYRQVNEKNSNGAAYVMEEMANFTFVTPCDAANPQRLDTITDEQGLLWMITGASSGSMSFCRKWDASRKTVEAVGTTNSGGK